MRHRSCLRMSFTVCAALALFGLSPLADTAPATPQASPSSAGRPSAPPTAEAVPRDVASYDLGLMLGSQLGHSGLEHDIAVDEFVRGLKEALGGVGVTTEQREVALQFMRHGRETLTARNQGLAREFLAQNANADGVTTTPSGLQYRVLTAGDAKRSSPGPNDHVTVNYRATLVDHTEFDSSYAHGRPAVFAMNGLIKGLHDALAMMTPGAKWQVFVPPELGYGTTSPPAIPPGALLIYELELVQVEPPGQVDRKLMQESESKRTGRFPASASAAPPSPK